MSCAEMMELMQRFLDHDLTDEEQQSMFSHISSCPECALLYERLCLVDEQLMQLPAVTPPYSIVDRILPLLVAQTPAATEPVIAAEQPAKVAEPAAVVPFRRRKLLSRLAYGTTAAAALILGVFLFQGYEGNQKQHADNVMFKSTVTESAAQGRVDSKMANEAPESASPMNTTEDSRPENSVNGDKSKQQHRETSPAPAAGGGAVDLSPTGLNVQDQYGTMMGPTDSNNQLEQGNEMRLGTTMDTMDSAKAVTPEAGSSLSDGFTDPSAVPPLSGAEPIQVSGDKKDSGSAMDNGFFADPAKSSSDNRVSFVAPDTLLQGMDRQGFSPTQTQELLSESEKHEAVVEDRRVIVRSRLGEIVFLSPQQWKATDDVRLSDWLNDFQLLYQVTREDGTQLNYLIDISLKLETQK